ELVLAAQDVLDLADRAISLRLQPDRGVDQPAVLVDDAEGDRTAALGIDQIVLQTPGAGALPQVAGARGVLDAVLGEHDVRRDPYPRRVMCGQRSRIIVHQRLERGTRAGSA